MKLDIALIQNSLIWEDIASNLRHFSLILDNLKPETDLIILPEMFTSGFTMNPEKVATPMHGEVVQWMQMQAHKHQSAIMGSVVMEEHGKHFNRLLFVNSKGEIAYYDKKHLFSLAGENQFYQAGNQKLIINYKEWKICPLICYDLRFPVFSRNVENYDLLIYVANWPKVRTNAWDILLKARAVENMAYTVGVNRIGHDEKGHEYIGHSQVIDYLGNEILSPQENEGVFYVKLEKQPLLETREKLNFLADRDEFELR
jgi:omega-amidase